MSPDRLGQVSADLNNLGEWLEHVFRRRLSPEMPLHLGDCSAQSPVAFRMDNWPSAANYTVQFAGRHLVQNVQVVSHKSPEASDGAGAGPEGTFETFPSPAEFHTLLNRQAHGFPVTAHFLPPAE
jgi:hypothetical protein